MAAMSHDNLSKKVQHSGKKDKNSDFEVKKHKTLVESNKNAFKMKHKKFKKIQSKKVMMALVEYL